MNGLWRGLFARMSIALAVCAAVPTYSMGQDDVEELFLEGPVNGPVTGPVDGYIELIPDQGPSPKSEQRAREAKKKKTGGAWTALAPVNGSGAAVCNASGDRYSCLALRCGKGRGLEFAFLFNVGQPGLSAELEVDGRPAATLAFATVTAGAEMVAPFDATRHADLLAAMKAGTALTFDAGFRHEFTLSGSSKAIDTTLNQCRDEAPPPIADAAPAVSNAPALKAAGEPHDPASTFAERTTIDLSVLDSKIPALTQACDATERFDMAERYYLDDRHRAAMTVLSIKDEPERQAQARKAVNDMASVRKQAYAAFGQNDPRSQIVTADEALVRYAAGAQDYSATQEQLRAVFARLRETASTPAEADYLLYLAVGDFGIVRFTHFNGEDSDAQSAIALAKKHAQLSGPTPRSYHMLRSYLQSDENHIERYPPAERMAVAAEMRRLASASGALRDVYTADLNLIRDFVRSDRKDEAMALARAVEPVAVARLDHAKRELTREMRDVPRNCWLDARAIETINEVLSASYTHAQAERAYEYEALETVLFGTIQTETTGAFMYFAKMAQVKDIDEAAYRSTMKLFADQERGANPDIGLPGDVSMALVAGDVFDDMLVPALARDFYEDAEKWMGDHPDLTAKARFSALAQLASFEWRSGSIARLEPLIAEARTLLAANAGSVEEGDIATFLEIEAAYQEAQLNDGLTAAALLGSITNAGNNALLKDHLRGRLCAGCGAALTDSVKALLGKLQQQYSGMTDGFASDGELLLLILTSPSAAIDDDLRKMAADLVTASSGFQTWKMQFKLARKGEKKPRTEAELVKLWLASRALGLIDAIDISGSQSELLISQLLVEPDIDKKRSMIMPIVDEHLSRMAEFGGDAETLIALDNYARLLQQAGYAGSARAFTENVARAASRSYSAGERSSWTPPSEEARLELAPMLGSVHARLARYAFEEERWGQADAELDVAADLMTRRLQREWQFGNERAVLTYRNMQAALRLSAQLRFLLANSEGAKAALPGLAEKALSDLQFAMLGDTALTMQSATRKRIYEDPELRAAVDRRDAAQDKLDQLEALERAIPSKLPWRVEQQRQAARGIVTEAAAAIEARLAVPEELGALRSMKLADIQRSLRPREALVVLHSGTSNLYGFVVRAGREPKLFISKTGSKELTDRITQLRREGAAFGAVDLNNAAALYQTLLDPAAQTLDGIDHLIVVGDGPVPATPFAMLVSGEVKGTAAAASAGGQKQRGAKSLLEPVVSETADMSAQPWLIRRYPISIAPNVGSIVSQRGASRSAAAPKAFFGVGDPMLRGTTAVASVEMSSLFKRGALDGAVLESLAPLPETATELRKLAGSFGVPDLNLLLGSDATRRRVIEARLSDYRVIAFATHGILAGEVAGAVEPGLVLSPDAGDPASGYFSLSDIMALKLNADMVILSACNTGGADGRPRAEAMSGLARGFIAAGARQLMVTLWSIPSDPTTRLTTGTVDALQADPTLDWPRAMQKSILKMIDEPVAPLDRHPASWAAFTILGVGSSI